MAAPHPAYDPKAAPVTHPGAALFLFYRDNLALERK
jgi:hypothetical protein